MPRRCHRARLQALADEQAPSFQIRSLEDIRAVQLLNNEFAACVLVALPHMTFDGRPLAQQPRRSSRRPTKTQGKKVRKCHVSCHPQEQKHKERKPA